MIRNCTKLSDYRVQVQILKSRLVEKGYVAESLQDIIEQVSTIDRLSLLEEKTRKADKGKTFSVPFITTFSTQHHQIQNIIQKHWYILGDDRTIKTFLPIKPQVIFRGVPSLRENCPQCSRPPDKKVSFFQNLAGYHQCSINEKLR